MRAFAFYDEARRGWVAEAGRFEIRVGASSADVRQRANVTLASAGFALLGVKDGNDVRLRAAQLSIARNPQWGGKPILVGAAPPFAMDNLTFTVVGPSKATPPLSTTSFS